MVIEPRLHIPEKIKVGDIIPIEVAISHPMRLPRDGVNAATGQAGSADYIEFFTARFEGNEFFRTRFRSAVSANPYLAFNLRIAGPGTLEVMWVDNNGRAWSLSRKLKPA